MHIVLIGLNYQTERSTGDKNFWIDLVTLLAKKMKRITIISIRKHYKKDEVINMDGCPIAVKYISPIFLETPDSSYSRPKIFWRKGAFPAYLGLIEKILDIRYIIKELKALYKRYPFENVHLMDNFGLGNRMIARILRKLKVAISVSAMSYQGRTPFIYHPYLRISYDHPYLFVVPYSIAFKNKLISIGIKENKLFHIPWGIFPDNSIKSMNTSMAKRKLKLPEKVLFLWTGYIQQIQKNDFLFAIRCAKSVIKKGLDAVFYFAFKPESFENDFRKFNEPKFGIYVNSTNKKIFDLLKLAADVFYSPIVNKRCIIAPPLTWIEMMASGMPILTTDVLGANEIIEDGNNGFIACDENDLIEKMFIIKENFYKMQKTCKEGIGKKYSIYNSVNLYIELWERIKNEL